MCINLSSITYLHVYLSVCSAFNVFQKGLFVLPFPRTLIPFCIIIIITDLSLKYLYLSIYISTSIYTHLSISISTSICFISRNKLLTNFFKNWIGSFLSVKSNYFASPFSCFLKLFLELIDNCFPKRQPMMNYF